MEVAGGDSGVETECDQESNDSSMSSLSLGGAVQEPPYLPPPGPTPPCRRESSSAAPAEDGYLGDCSSDGGNEKNFPLPPDWGHCACHPSRASLPPSPLQSDTADPHSPPSEDVEPPAGLQFHNVAPSESGGGLGYHLLPHQDWNQQGRLRTKMRGRGRGPRTSGLRSRYNSEVQDDWNRVKTSIAERKLRGAANTNNTEMLETLLTNQLVSVNSVDEHKRSALHFAAAKVRKFFKLFNKNLSRFIKKFSEQGYSDVVELLLRHGADPNQKDRLGELICYIHHK